MTWRWARSGGGARRTKGGRASRLLVAGTALVMAAGGIATLSTEPPAHTSHHRLSAARRATTHRPGRPPTPGEVLLEPGLLGALASGHEPVDPSDIVGTAIVSGRLLFVGASYSVGLGATGRALSFPDLLAARFHEQFHVDAASGTGFQNPGPLHQGTFAERMLHDPDAPPPRLVLIQGGRDDYRFPLAQEYQATLETIELAQRRFDEAQVVVLGPIPASLPVTPRMLALNEQIQRAAVAARAGYINPLTEGWITEANVHSYAGRIRGHPNDAGYAYIASRLRQQLPVALTESRPPLDPDGT